MQTTSPTLSEFLKEAAPKLSLLSKLVRGTGRVADAAVLGLPAKATGALVGIPKRMLRNAAESAAIGRRIRRGPMAGRRLQAVSGGPGKGLIPISAQEYRAIRSAPMGNPEVYRGSIGGKRYYFKRKYVPGGIVGTAMKHPLLTGAGVGGLYLLGRNTGTASSLSQQAIMRELAMQQQLKKQISSPVSFENPLAGDVWK